MHARIFLLLIALIICSGCNREIEVINGHAHNDYENESPLLDALQNGFCSVEADVHLVDGNLYVCHDPPRELIPGLTLESLYLMPLSERIIQNNGTVYPSYSGPFYLMIDFKSEARPTYTILKEILSNYLPVLSVVENGWERQGAVKILISGNRPVDEILLDEPKLVGIDGRPGDLDRKIPGSIMPLISDDYSNYSSWDGSGEIDSGEYDKLKNLVKRTHSENKKLRLWGFPDNEDLWKFLLDLGVDLINTDHIPRYKSFVLEYHSSDFKQDDGRSGE